MTQEYLKDLFKSDYRLPSKVCIVAPGPNGVPHYKRLRWFTICVNYAITIPKLPRRDLWIVADKTGIEKDWFQGADNEFDGDRIFSEKIEKARITTRGYKRIYHAQYVFQYEPLSQCPLPSGRGPYYVIPDRLRGDGTTAGMAIEFAARFGAEEIVLCGIDMSGNKYYDGKKSTCSISDRNGTWQFVPYLDSLINWVKSKGIEIYSYSDTKLDVEVYER